LEKILNPGMVPKNIPASPQTALEFQATPEQFFALIADNMMGR